MSDLVRKLAEGSHPVEMSLRPDRTVAALKTCLDRGYVHIRFTDTRGGTELGVRLDPSGTNVTQADFEAGTGTLNLAGALSLDGVNVRCLADIDLPSMCGVGRLEPVVES